MSDLWTVAICREKYACWLRRNLKMPKDLAALGDEHAVAHAFDEQPADLLEQSSIKAGMVSFKFIEGQFEIPGCYYEFARRYPDADGKLYSGFVAKSADKIFQSTDFYKKHH